MKIVGLQAKKARLLSAAFLFVAANNAYASKFASFIPTRDDVAQGFNKATQKLQAVQEKVQPRVTTVQEKAKELSTQASVTIPLYSDVQKAVVDRMPNNVVAKTAIKGVFDQLIPAAVNASLPKSQDREKEIVGLVVNTVFDNQIFSCRRDQEDTEVLIVPGQQFQSRNLNIALSKETSKEALCKDIVGNGSSVKIDTDYSHLNAVRAFHAILFSKDGLASMPGFNLLRAQLPDSLQHKTGLVAGFFPNSAPALKHASTYLFLVGKMSVSDYAKTITTVSSAIELAGFKKLNDVPLVGAVLSSFVGKTAAVSLMSAAGNKENGIKLRFANQAAVTLLQAKTFLKTMNKIAFNKESRFGSRIAQNGLDGALAGIALYNSVPVLRDLYKEYKEKNKSKLVTVDNQICGNK